MQRAFEETGDMLILTGKTVLSALHPPYPYGGEFVAQFLFALRLCWFPLLVTMTCVGYAVPGMQAANFLVLIGALDRLGALFVLASIRELGRSSAQSSSPASPARRSPPTSGRARSARSSTHCWCSASIRSRTSSSPASSR